MANDTSSLSSAKKAKADEFYTQLVDVENEMKHYRKHFKGKTILCNCDDPRESKFFHYFSFNFERLGLKKLIATCYKNQDADLFSKGDSEKAIYLEYNGDQNDNRVPDAEEIGIHHFEGDGDFRSDECIELLKQADIVITNPPFSLFREYVAQLIEFEKEFIIIGNQNAITYKETFKLIKQSKLWLGVDNSSTKWFQVPEDFEIKNESLKKVEDGKVYFKMRSTVWFTNLNHKKRNEEIILYKRYTQEEYPNYDNYDGINVDKTKDIPLDYDGFIGVPISFMERYNPEQFEIIKFRKGDDGKDLSVNGKCPYFRIIIKNKKVEV